MREVVTWGLDMPVTR